MMQPKFRVAKEEDVKGIVALCNEVFEEDTSLVEAERLFREMRSDKNQIHFQKIWLLYKIYLIISEFIKLFNYIDYEFQFICV